MINLADTLKSRTGEAPPNWQDTVTLRVKKSDFKLENSKGNPMTTLTCEIVEPDKVSWLGTVYDLSSVEVPLYMIYTNKLSGGQRKSGLQLIAEMHSKLDLPLEIDENNPDRKIYEGLTFRILVKSSERKMQRSTVNEDGAKIREDVLGEDGQPVKQGWQLTANLDDIIGKAVYTGNKAF